MSAAKKPAQAAQSIDAKLEALTRDYVRAAKAIDPTILEAMSYTDETMGDRHPVAGVCFGRAHAPIIQREEVAA